MLILTKSDIQKLFTMKEAIQASTEALRLYSEGKSITPLRVNIDIPKKEGQSLFMPAYINEINAIGIKIVSVYPNNMKFGKSSVPAQMILMDGSTGEVCAMLDGTYLTQLRTGALQGAATHILSRQNAKIAALFGTGGQAATQLEAMLNVRELEEVRVFDINMERAQQYSATMQNTFAHFNTRIIPASNSDMAVIDADIITTITTSKNPVFNGSLVKKGTHINGIGSYTPEMQEIPSFIIENADKIIFDTKEGVLAEAGDILIPMRANVVTASDFDGELGEVIIGKIKGRESDEEITLFKAVGSAVLDVVVAHKIYVKALEMNVGQHVGI